MQQAQTDEALIRQFQSGDGRAFNLIMQRHQEVVLRVCLRLLQSRSDSLDAGQDIFIKVHSALASFRPQARFSTWLYRITINHCFNVLRSRKRRRWISSFTGATSRVNLHETPDPTEDPLQSLEKRERIKQVRQALARLPEDQRAAIVLHRYEGLTYAEIAEVMGCSVAAIESRLHRAKKKLYQSLAAYMDQGV